MLRQSMVFTNSPAMLQPEVLVARAHQKFDEEGTLTDEGNADIPGRLSGRASDVDPEVQKLTLWHKRSSRRIGNPTALPPGDSEAVPERARSRWSLASPVMRRIARWCQRLAQAH